MTISMEIKLKTIMSVKKLIICKLQSIWMAGQTLRKNVKLSRDEQFIIYNMISNHYDQGLVFSCSQLSLNIRESIVLLSSFRNE